MSALIGTTFPMKELTLLQGNSMQLADLKGKPSLVNFWFTRCAPCLDEIPVFNRLVKEHQNAFHFLAISFEKASTVERFLKKQPFDFVHAIDAKAFIDSIQLRLIPLRCCWIDTVLFAKCVEDYPTVLVRLEL